VGVNVCRYGFDRSMSSGVKGLGSNQRGLVTGLWALERPIGRDRSVDYWPRLERMQRALSPKIDTSEYTERYKSKRNAPIGAIS
jgi:hypothetical protein